MLRYKAEFPEFKDPQDESPLRMSFSTGSPKSLIDWIRRKIKSYKFGDIKLVYEGPIKMMYLEENEKPILEIK